VARKQGVNLSAMMGVQEKLRQHQMDWHLPWRTVHAVE
jgi:hypothetical protein